MKLVYLLFTATILSISSFAQVIQTKIVNNGGSGPYKAMVAQEASLTTCAVYRPQNLADAVKSGTKLPIIIFANGACVNSSLEYERMLTDVASYGYVIIAGGPLQMQANDRPSVSVDETLLIESLNWITKQAADNTSEYYGRVDITKVAASGHSCGGAQVIAVAENPAIKNYILFNSGMGNMSMGGATPADLQTLHAPILYIVGGESDVAYSNALIDYSRITNVEVSLANLINGGHSGTFWETYGGSNSRMMVKWLDWHFKNASGNCKVFLNNDLSEFPGWEMFSKNYDFDCSFQIALTAPLNNAVYSAPASVIINANATISNGTISKVEFYNGTTKLGEDATSPYSYSWTDVAEGTYSITAVATDNTGKKVTSSSVSIKVNPAQGPYLGTAWAIPGKIELENFDVGGNGAAYLDNTPGTSVSPAPNFRTDEDVDIENCTDVGAGYNLGWTTAGEWLEYTVNVAQTGKYFLYIRVACNGDGRTISFTTESGTDIARNIPIPNTGGWQTWIDVEVSDVPLTSGKQVIRLTIGATDYVNLNYMRFVASATAPGVSLTSPANNSEFTTNQTVTLSATATSATGTIASVKFYDGTTLLNTDNTSPYSFDWTGMSVGSHSITAVATDNSGLSATSQAVIFQVNAAPLSISLKQGWNFIGCPLNGKTAVETALSSIIDNVVSIKDMDSYYLKINESYLNTLKTLDWGKGYFIKVNAPCKLFWSGN